MRLALFTDTYAPQMNGVSRTLGRLVDVVRERGGEARVFTTSAPRAQPDESVHRWPSMRCPLYPELRMSMPDRHSAMEALREFKPTLVHAATPFGLGLSARAAARALSLPFVSSYHTSFSDYARFYGLGYLEQPIWRALRAFHNGGRRTFCPTDAIRQELASHGFDRLAVWGRGIDRQRFAPSRRSRDMRLRMGAIDSSIVVAYVGRVAREKGLDHLLAASRRVASCDSRITFAFAGDGPYLEHCRSAASSNCRFLGRLEGLDLAAFYASADVFLFPSATDTFGNVLLEAMASAVPILAADTRPSREIVGNAGMWYPPDDATALASAILEFAFNAPRRAEAGALSLTRSADFDWTAVFDALFEEYDCAIREPAAAAPASRRHPEKTLAFAAKA